MSGEITSRAIRSSTNWGKSIPPEDDSIPVFITGIPEEDAGVIEDVEFILLLVIDPK